MESLLTVKDLAAILRYTEATVYNLASAHPNSLPPSIRIGRSLRWRQDVVDGWIREKESLLPGQGVDSPPQDGEHLEHSSGGKP